MRPHAWMTFGNAPAVRAPDGRRYGGRHMVFPCAAPAVTVDYDIECNLSCPLYAQKKNTHCVNGESSAELRSNSFTLSQ